MSQAAGKISIKVKQNGVQTLDTTMNAKTKKLVLTFSKKPVVITGVDTKITNKNTERPAIKKESKTKKAVVKKKEFKLAGQKYATPAKTDALYKFYTSLLQQRPDSVMAKTWCIEHGVEV